MIDQIQKEITRVSSSSANKPTRLIMNSFTLSIIDQEIESLGMPLFETEEQENIFGLKIEIEEDIVNSSFCLKK